MTQTLVTTIRSPFHHVIAFEVSKVTLVVHALPADEQCSIENTEQAVRRLLKIQIKLNAKKSLGALLVVCEATGGFERAVLDVAAELKLPVHRAHGNRVRFFARYRGLMAKTDSIDAKMLAEFGRQTEDLRLWIPPPPESEALRALQGRRSEIQNMIIAETARIQHARHKAVLKSLKAHVAALKAALATIEAEISELVRSSDILKTKTQLMRSVIGVGPVTAHTLLAYLPDIGQLKKGQAARLAGLAPINDDSGKKQGARHIEPGRNEIKKCLYMAAGVAMKTNPVLKIFADRLKGNGYPFKYVVTAVMRKLVVILNAVLRDGQPWKPARPA
jgi:transposase